MKGKTLHVEGKKIGLEHQAIVHLGLLKGNIGKQLCVCVCTIFTSLVNQAMQN